MLCMDWRDSWTSARRQSSGALRGWQQICGAVTCQWHSAFVSLVVYPTWCVWYEERHSSFVVVVVAITARVREGHHRQRRVLAEPREVSLFAAGVPIPCNLFRPPHRRCCCLFSFLPDDAPNVRRSLHKNLLPDDLLDASWTFMSVRWTSSMSGRLDMLSDQPRRSNLRMATGHERGMDGRSPKMDTLSLT